MPPCLHRVATSRCGAGAPHVVVRGTGHHHWPCNTMPMSPLQSPLTMKVSDSLRRGLPFPAGKRVARCSFPGDAESSHETPDAERQASAAAAVVLTEDFYQPATAAAVYCKRWIIIMASWG